MEFSSLAVMFLLVSLLPVTHAQGDFYPQAKLKPTLRSFPWSLINSEDTIILSCDLQDLTGLEFFWYRNTQIVNNVATKTNTLSVNVSNAGEIEYQCSARWRIDYKTVYSDRVKITVKEKPKLTVRVNPQSFIYTGDTITLSCDLQETGWEFFWYRNSQLERNEPRDTKKLSVRVDTAGETVYQCRASKTIYNIYNNYDHVYTRLSDSVTITARVKPKPVASINPDKQVFSGDTVTLRCEIQDKSVSRWQYSWYKDASLSPVSSVQMYTISSVEVTHTGKYTCKGRESGGSRSSHLSDAVTLTVSERPQAVLSVSPQNWLTEGDSVTLSCEVTDSSTDWTFSWYTVVPHRDGVTAVQINHVSIMYVELLSDSSRGSGGSYTLSPSALHHTGVYVCRGERGEPVSHILYSNPQPLWISGESPPVSLSISPSRIKHFTRDSLSLSCEDQSNSTGWTVRRYTDSEGVLDCSQWGSVTGSTCYISFLSTSYTGVYWCESESGENSNPVNITVHDGDVILESPLYPVTEGHPLNLHCLYRNTNLSNLQVVFYKDGSVVQNQTTGEMIIHKVLKSDEGFYHCKNPERGESPKSRISVRRSGSLSKGETVGVAVGLSLVFLVIVLLILMVLLWYYKMNKDAELNDVMYAEIQLKPMEQEKRTQEKSSACDTVYSELHLSMK